MPKFLVVDDSDSVREVAYAILTSLEFYVEVAASLDDATHFINDGHPDLMLLDWHLPNQDPIEFLKDFRKSEAEADPPRHCGVIYCMTSADQDAIAAAKSAGADEILVKPFDRTTIESAVAKFQKLETT